MASGAIASSAQGLYYYTGYENCTYLGGGGAAAMRDEGAAGREARGKPQGLVPGEG